MASDALTKLKNRLQDFVDSRTAASPSREIVDEFRKFYGAEIDAVGAELADKALVKFVDDVSRRRQGASDPRQADLFRGISLPHAIAVPVLRGGRIKHVRTNFLSAKIREAEAYSTYRPKQRQPVRDKNVAALLVMVREYVTSPDMTVGEALAAMRAADRGNQPEAGVA